MAKQLSPMQKAFCDYYLECGNATEAAKKAGYSEKNAHKIGPENLTKPTIRQYIDERLNSMASNRIAKAEEVLEYLTNVMRSKIKDQFGLEISIADRTKAAELLGKRYRLFTDKPINDGGEGSKTEKALQKLIEKVERDLDDR